MSLTGHLYWSSIDIIPLYPRRDYPGYIFYLFIPSKKPFNSSKSQLTAFLDVCFFSGNLLVFHLPLLTYNSRLVGTSTPPTLLLSMPSELMIKHLSHSIGNFRSRGGSKLRNGTSRPLRSPSDMVRRRCEKSSKQRSGSGKKKPVSRTLLFEYSL